MRGVCLSLGPMPSLGKFPQKLTPGRRHSPGPTAGKKSAVQEARWWWQTAGIRGHGCALHGVKRLGMVQVETSPSQALHDKRIQSLFSPGPTSAQWCWMSSVEGLPSSL